MSEQTFKSPGFFESEIDLSGTSVSSTGTSAGIIGTSTKGPAFLPTTVSSYAEFSKIFGAVDGKQFGPYSVKEYLENGNAVTYVRVLGAGGGGKTKGYEHGAGFKLTGRASDKTATTGDDEYDIDDRPIGKVQFIVASHNETPAEAFGYPIFTDNDTIEADGVTPFDLVRAMILVPKDARVMITDIGFDVTTWATATRPQRDDKATPDSSGIFKLIISGATGESDDGMASLKIFSASLDPSNSALYIKNILNSDPSQFESENHVLYAHFPVEEELATIDLTTTSIKVAYAGNVGDAKLGKFNERFSGAKTTSFISQPFGATEYELFHFETLSHGTAMNSSFKVTIADLKASIDPADPWGTFTVQIRNFYDTDGAKQIIERFADCNLDLDSPNYIAKRIGDKKISFNFDTRESARRLTQTGMFSNKSDYVRVVINKNVSAKRIPTSTLPIGFKGLPNLDVSTAKYCDESNPIADLTTVFPPVPMRYKLTKGSVLTRASGRTFTGDPGTLEQLDAKLCWGTKFTRLDVTAYQSNTGTVFGSLIPNLVKYLGHSDDYESSTAPDTRNNNKFTLAKVAFSDVLDLGHTDKDTIAEVIGDLDKPPIEMVSATYMRNGDYFTTNNVIVDTDGVVVSTEDGDFGGAESSAGKRITMATLLGQKDKSDFNLYSGFNKFTNVFYGAKDGTNILDTDMAAMNDKASSAQGLNVEEVDVGMKNEEGDNIFGLGANNNVVNSFRMAAKILTDPMISRVNLLNIPGMRDHNITHYVLSLVEEYGMALYLMDMASYGSSGGTPTRIFTNDSLKPDTSATISSFIGKGYNNSYAAVYYPDIILYDGINDVNVEAPSSIAAMSAIAYTDKNKYPWFAPAGFNRGSLDNVEGTTSRLNTANRDELYEARINPIATFPNSGYVIFGQKTLQMEASSLDRVNVRRMLLKVKREISDVARLMLFENNTASTRAKFASQMNAILSRVQSQQGIDKFSVTVDSSNNTPQDIEANKMNGRIVLVPTRAIEYVAIDFIVTSSGVSFD